MRRTPRSPRLKSTIGALHPHEITDRPCSYLKLPRSLGPSWSELIDNFAVSVEKRNTGRSIGCHL
jgi:hypothetical protein